MIHTPWMFSIGCTIIGWMAPELFAAILKKPIPMAMNVMGAIAGYLIATSFT